MNFRPMPGRLSATAAVLSWGLLCSALASPVLAQRSPQDELAELRPAADMEVSLFASEPLITNPAAIDIDTQGRVWVAEIQWYRAAAKDPPSDKIKVLEDTDGDGRADKATVFAEGLFCPMSICVAGDRVYVATSPDLWVYEDKNHDLKADGPPKKLLTGFGGRNHDHGAHSLVLGPDHKWWMSHGDTGFKVTGTDGKTIEYGYGAVIRGELDGSKLELVAVNFRNPYEVCVSSFGESFLTDNDNDGNFSARVCWLMEGGDYGWFGHPPAKTPPGTPFGEHWHFRGHIPGFVPATLVTGFGSPCGMCFYEGDAFGPHYKNAPLHTDAGPAEVRMFRHENSGAGMQATSQVFLASDGDKYFRPDDICAAPDGSLYVSDWYDGGVGGHAYNNPTQGRIFQLRPKGKKLERIGKPGPYASVEDAVEGLKNPNLATQFLARERLLAEGSKSVAALRGLLDDREPSNVARALWLLDRRGGDARTPVVERLKSDDARMRALAARILRRHGAEYAAAILPLADDADGAVRREVLLALPAIIGPANSASGTGGDAAFAALVKLASTYDGSDRYLLEAINIAAANCKPKLYGALKDAGRVGLGNLQLLRLLDPNAAAALLVKSMSDKGSDDAARSNILRELGGTPSIEAGRAVLQIAADTSAGRDLRRQAMALVSTNFDGDWKALREEESLAKNLNQMLADPDWQLAALDLVGEKNLRQFAPQVLKLVTESSATPAVRRRAIKAAAQIRAPGAETELATLLDSGDKNLSKAALAALVELQDWKSVRRLLIAKDVPEGLQADAAKSAIATTGGALVLLRLIEQHELPEALVPQVLARAQKHPDVNIRVLFERFIPEEDRPKRLGGEVDPAAILALKADADRGRQIFFKSSAAQCKKCHRVQGFGETLGPDLSQIGKKYERATLLETILDPSKAIAPEYVAYLLETTGGQVYAGFLVEKTDKEITLRDVEGKQIRVPASEVALFEPQKKSLMPELVLRDVTAQDAADLLAFLTSLTNAPAATGN